jgi:hypothetical protein
LRVVEPWVSAFSFPIYRFLHQEGATLGLDPKRPFQKGDSKEPFEGDAGVTRALASRVDAATWRALGFESRAVFAPINGFAYLLSLGFKHGSLLPEVIAGPMIALDRVAAQGAHRHADRPAGAEALLRARRRHPKRDSLGL